MGTVFRVHFGIDVGNRNDNLLAEIATRELVLVDRVFAAYYLRAKDQDVGKQEELTSATVSYFLGVGFLAVPPTHLDQAIQAQTVLIVEESYARSIDAWAAGRGKCHFNIDDLLLLGERL
jgi:hypothetical protein